jgi:hypothetical protein
MPFDDLLGHLLGEVAFGRLTRSRRAQLIARLFFGCLGAGLGIAGAIYMARYPQTTNAGFHLSTVALFLFMACFWLFNAGLGRRWKWPAVGFALSLMLMFVMRIAFGA